MPEPLIFMSRFRVRDGRIADVEVLARAFVGFVDENEADVLGSHYFVDEPAGELGYVQVVADPEAMDRHLQLTHDRIAAALELVEPIQIIVCGSPGPLLSEALDHNRRVGAAVTVLPTHVDGFFRAAVSSAVPSSGG